MTIMYGNDVGQTTRDALGADPEYVHPSFSHYPVWVIHNGSPQRARIVGSTAAALDVFYACEQVVIRVERGYVYWTLRDAEHAQAVLDHDYDL